MLIGQLVIIDGEYYVFTRYLSQLLYEFIKVQEDNSKDPEVAVISDLSKVELVELYPGDEVRICRHNSDFLDLDYVDLMKKYEGETTKILEEDTDDYKTYYLECTKFEFYWAANWFIPVKFTSNRKEDKLNILLDKIYKALGR